MRLRARTFEPFGPYLLLRKIESDSFCETWRARPRSSSAESDLVAIRRFRAAGFTKDDLTTVSPALSPVSGPAIARRQSIETVEGETVLVHEYEDGRSLSHIVDRSRNSPSGRLPMPEDLALTVSEKVLLALGAMHGFGPEENPTVHGGLLPHFVWLTADGEVRIVGQELGTIAHAALEGDAASLVRPFLAPEVVLGNDATPRSDVYSAGALLYLLLTGEPPPECRTAEQNVTRIQGGRSCLSGDPLPSDLQTILVRALAPEPALRFQSASEMRDAVTRKLHAKDSGPTTFNLAFYLHTLLRKEYEAERAERAAELSDEAQIAPREKRSRAGAKGKRLAFVALALVLTASAITAAWIRLSSEPAPPRLAPQEPRAEGDTEPRQVSPAPPLVPAPSETAMTNPIVDDPAAKERAFEEAVNARLEREMAKLQSAHDEELRRQRRAAESRADDSRRAASSSGNRGPGSAERAREGDLVEISSVDQAPVVVRSVPPSYPEQASAGRIEGNVIVSALVSETGRVLDTRVMRGDARGAGLDEAAVAAVRQWQFTPAVKDGQRVRTWAPVSVAFRLPE